MENIRHLIALIDYENIGGLDAVPLSRYDEIILFTGPVQEIIRLPATTVARDIRIRQVPTVLKNNVDFHLVLELGRLSVSTQQTDFHIISHDKGYDGIISFLNQSGYHCQRLAPVLPPVVESKKTERVCNVNAGLTRCAEQWADEIQSRYKKSVKTMPKTVKSLGGYLKSLLGAAWTETLAGQIKNELVKRRVLRVYEKTIVWKN